MTEEKPYQIITSRAQVTEMILANKAKTNISWSQVAKVLASSREWATAACLGQMQLSKHDAESVARLFDLSDEACAWLQIAPYKNDLSIPPTDPLLYRLYEIIGVYGPALKELIHEDRGDGIMSAVDLKVGLDTKSDPSRVSITFSGKFLDYKKF